MRDIGMTVNAKLYVFLRWESDRHHQLLFINSPSSSCHPRHFDIVHSLNHGFLLDTVFGDDMPVDDYLLGLDRPVAVGVIIGII